MKNLKIKVCGMRMQQNIDDLVKLNPDYIGFIFAEKSPRYFPNGDVQDVATIPADIKKTGVFVNPFLEVVVGAVKKYKLDAVQLHGNEAPNFCSEFKWLGMEVIKAFGVDETFDFSTARKYEGHCDLFIFDTKVGNSSGGTGQKFDWSKLDEYAGNVPFLLSGGIGPDDAEAVKEIKHDKFVGLDLNSKFEIEPGLKNIEILKEFLETIKA